MSPKENALKVRVRVVPTGSKYTTAAINLKEKLMSDPESRALPLSLSAMFVNGPMELECSHKGPSDYQAKLKKLIEVEIPAR